MLSRLRAAVSGTAARRSPSTALTASQIVELTKQDEDALFHAITAPDVSPLVRLVDARSLLNISLEHSNRPYSSILLEVRLDHGYAVLDDFSGGGLPDALIDTHPKFTARGKLAREPIAFTSSIMATAVADGGRLHQIALPSKLDYRHTRAFRRLPIRGGQPVAFRASTTDGGSWSGNVTDLSAAGLGALVAIPPRSAQPEVGDQLPRCLLDVGGRRLLSPPLAVSNVSKPGYANLYRLGLRFVNGPRPELAAQALQALGQFKGRSA